MPSFKEKSNFSNVLSLSSLILTIWWLVLRREGCGMVVGTRCAGGGQTRLGLDGLACTALIRNYPIAAYNMVAARLTDLRAADSTQVPFKK